MNTLDKICFLVFALLLNIKITNIVEERAKTVYKTNQTPMHDVFIETLPNLSKYHYLCDILCWIPLLIYIAYFRGNIPDEITLMLGLIFMIRAMALFPTTFPSIYCKNKNRQGFTFGQCHDCMFSGHLAMTLLPILLLIFHGWSPAVILYPIVFSVFQIASRSHYSVDVIISWCITSLIFCVIQFKCSKTFFSSW